MATTSVGDKDHYSAKPPIFDGEKLDYWNDRIESFFLGFDADIWDIVVDGYTCPVNSHVVKILRDEMSVDQKKKFKDHYRARTILLNAISYEEYEKITNRESAKSIYDSLRMTHEGNAQVKETKALALVQKYKAFKMEDDEYVEAMFSRFQMLIAGLRVLDKGYSTADHAKKIIRSLPKKWRHMVTALKLTKDLNQISLEELISSLRSHEIELHEDEPLRRQKYVALKSSPEKTKAFQAEEES
jgi:predicted house-cleaning NTP pyrophosphatase (Maf/HAM1 superfamily)